MFSPRAKNPAVFFVFLAFLAFSGLSAHAATQTIWSAPSATPATTNRVPVDTSALSGPGSNSFGDILGLLNGDCTVNTTNGQITCNKTGGVPFATVCTSASASDLSTGTLAAARLPVPSLSALGGVEAINQVGSKWINSIDTSGVPHLSQPQDADINFQAITTGNVNNSTHGYCPALPNDSTKFLNGVGVWAAPSSGVTFTGDGTVLSSTPSAGPTMTAALANAGAKSLLGNPTGVSAAPSYTSSPVVSGSLTASTLVSTVSTGTPPMTVTSTTPVTNLSIGGNAGTCTALQTGRAINGVTFDGTAAITVTAAAGTLTGSTLNSGVTASSLTSVGTLTGGATGSGFTLNFGTSTQSGKVGLANGGTNADLSATGAAHNVLEQTSSGAAITVGQLACSDLSNAAASCSTDTTSASNISSGTLNVARLPSIAGHTYLGNNTGSSAAAAAITTTQLTADLNQFTSTLQGLVPGSGGGTSNFLRADGTWAAPAGSGTVTTTGSPASGNLAKFSGATSVTNGDISGDCTTSGTLAVTCTKTSGSAFVASATTDTTNATNISSGTLAFARHPASMQYVTAAFMEQTGGL